MEGFFQIFSNTHMDIHHYFPEHRPIGKVNVNLLKQQISQS